MTEDEMVGRYHGLDGREFEQAPGDGEGQGSPASRGPRGGGESDTTERRDSSGTNKVPASESSTEPGLRLKGFTVQALNLHPGLLTGLCVYHELCVHT